MSAKKYDNDYKVESVKLALEVGQSKAAKELGISKNGSSLFCVEISKVKCIKIQVIDAG